MKPLVILLIVFVVALAISVIATGSWDFILSGNIAMCVMLCFTALGHFMFTKGMVLMMPGFIPFKKAIVYITGVAEITLGIALLFPMLRLVAGTVLIVLLIVMLPANIHAAMKRVNLETAGYDGKGVTYLWFRIPMQAFLIGWVWYFSVNR